MTNDIYLEFSDPSNSVDANAFNAFADQAMLEKLALGGVSSCRRYVLRLDRERTEYPARYRFLSIYELDSQIEQIGQAFDQFKPSLVSPDWPDELAVSTQLCHWLDGGPDLTSRDHLFVLFSTVPHGSNFDHFNDWYRGHLQENLRASQLLSQGWRYRLLSSPRTEPPGPEHCAFYALEGSFEDMLADTNRAVTEGRSSLIEGWHSTAGFDAVALGNRHMADG